jgi:ATP-dependent Clp protease ATP-binding subunit ClpA
MAYFKSFSPRARRVIFLAHWKAKKEKANEIFPEHILTGLLKEDPELFALVSPGHPHAAKELEDALVAKRGDSVTSSSNEVSVRLSKQSKKIIRAASQERERLGHTSVGTQHLLLAILGPERKRTGWLRRRELPDETVARRVLLDYGITVEQVDAQTKNKVVTPLTWVLDDSIIKLNAQLAALAELLISKSIFERSEFVALLDQNAEPIPTTFFAGPLLDALLEKGKLKETERAKLQAIALQQSPQEPEQHE